jgi:hypothetical protein
LFIANFCYISESNIRRRRDEYATCKYKKDNNKILKNYHEDLAALKKVNAEDKKKSPLLPELEISVY